MAIRVFISKWSEATLANGNIQITDDIDEYLADLSLSAPVVSINSYGATDPQQGNRPGKTYLLKVMRGDLLQSEWDDLHALQNVDMFPPHDFNQLIGELSNPQRNAIQQVLNFVGIPDNQVMSDTDTYGGMLKNILLHMNADNGGWGEWETLPSEWA